MKWNAFSFVGKSIEKTKKLLFPFNLKYWMKLGFVSLFTIGGGFGGTGFGGNWSFPVSNDKTSEITENAVSNLSGKISWSLAGILIAIFVLFVLIITFIRSVFTFIFFDALLNKNYSIKQGWGKHKARGGSLFGFLILLGLIFLVVLAAILSPIIIKMFGVGFVEYFKSFSWKDFLILIPLFLLFLIWLLIYSVFMTFAIDFGAPEMYFSNVGMREALKRVFRNIRTQKLESFVYVLAKIVFSIAVVLIGAAIVIALVFVAIIPALIIFLPLYFISVVAMVVLLIPFILFLIYVYVVVALPLNVFMWCFTLNCYEKLFNKRVLK